VLLAGLRGPRFGRAALFTVPIAWLVRSIAGLWVAPQVTLPVATPALTIALGALAAVDRPLPLAMFVGFAVVLGLVHARSSGLAAAGIAVALFVLVALLAGQTATVRTLWARIAVRVMGSWITVTGIFMLGWAVRAC
jgi:hydrogenase/urease accessory protein HupE